MNNLTTTSAAQRANHEWAIHDLGWTLIEAANAGKYQQLQAIIHSPQFRDIGCDALGWALVEAAKRQNPECETAIEYSNRYAEISREDTNRAYEESHRSENLTREFMQAIKAGGFDYPHLKTIIDSPKFQKIAPFQLTVALRDAIKAGKSDCCRAIVASNRFREVDPSALGATLEVAAKAGNSDCCRAIIASDRFREISCELLTRVLTEAAEAENPACYRLIADSSRSREIYVGDREQASNALTARMTMNCLRNLFQGE